MDDRKLENKLKDELKKSNQDFNQQWNDSKKSENLWKQIQNKLSSKDDGWLSAVPPFFKYATVVGTVLVITILVWHQFTIQPKSSEQISPFEVKDYIAMAELENSEEEDDLDYLFSIYENL